MLSKTQSELKITLQRLSDELDLEKSIDDWDQGYNCGVWHAICTIVDKHKLGSFDG